MECVGENWGKPRRTSVRNSDFLVEIRTRHLSITSQKCYRLKDVVRWRCVFGTWVGMFRRKVLPPSSRYKRNSSQYTSTFRILVRQNLRECVCLLSCRMDSPGGSEDVPRLVGYVPARAGRSGSWCNVCRVLVAERAGTGRAASRNCSYRRVNATLESTARLNSFRTRGHLLTGRYSDEGLEGRSLIPGRGKVFFSSPRRPDRLCGPITLLSSWYWWLFFRGKCGRGVKLTTHLHLVLRSRMVELYCHFHSCLHGVVLVN
jgi:hypothetical protein